MARDPYEVVLADLRAKRDDIDRVIRSLEALRPAPSVSAQASPHAVGPSEESPFRGMSIVDAAREALRDHMNPLGTAEIAVAIQAGGLIMNSAEPTNTVSSVLHRAWQSGGNIVKTGRGKWGLDEWFPGKYVYKKDEESEDQKFGLTLSSLPKFDPPPPPPPSGLGLVTSSRPFQPPTIEDDIPIPR